MIKNWKNLSLLMAAMFTSAALCTSCSSDDEDNAGDNGGNDNTPELPTDKYPSGAIVWSEDTTVVLTNHYIVPVGASLYIEQGAKVVASNVDVKPEIIVLGSLYALGTAEKPVTFTVADELKTDRFSGNWGGIICGFDAPEVYLNYTTVEYGGATTTEESASFQHQLFKTESGSSVPGLHFCNPEGRMIITNSTFINNADDHIYITGGQSIVANNKFISNGYDGGEAINYKSECLADIAYNIIYDANTNAFKLSNSGFVNLQSNILCYNNTIANTGWRRPKIKGGGIWLEENILVGLYNNLSVDCRWGLKTDTSDPHDERSVITPNYYFSSTETGVAQMAASEENGILNGANDIYSATAGDKNPLFAGYTQQSNININVGANEGDIPQTWSNSWDFSLQAGSPALTGGNTTFNRNFSSTAIVMTGLENVLESNAFTSPAPAAYFGAYGQK